MKLSMRYLLLATLYGLIGMLMGIAMGARENFTLMPVHAHLNLLGWVALTLYGIVHRLIPALEQSKFAKVQFYAANGGLILLIPSLAFFLLGHKAVLPVMIVGEFLTVFALGIFLANLWKNRMA